jgi:hypothetical protein
VTSALVGFLGVVVGLAVGFGYRFWSTRREELMAATIATTILRDAARDVQEGSSDATLSCLWDEQRVALIRLTTPAGDYEMLARSIRAVSHADSRLVLALDRLTTLFWREHQAFILTPLIKYIRRDDLSDKVSGIVLQIGAEPS